MALKNPLYQLGITQTVFNEGQQSSVPQNVNYGAGADLALALAKAIGTTGGNIANTATGTAEALLAPLLSPEVEAVVSQLISGQQLAGQTAPVENVFDTNFVTPSVQQVGSLFGVNPLAMDQSGDLSTKVAGALGTGVGEILPSVLALKGAENLGIIEPAIASFQSATKAVPLSTALNTLMDLPASFGQSFSQGQLNLPEFGGRVALSAGAGAAGPFAARTLGLGAEKMGEMVNALTKRSAQSDTVKVMKDMSARRQQSMQAAQLTEQAQPQVQALVQPQVLTSKAARPIANIAPVQGRVEKLETDINTIAEFINETRTKPLAVTPAEIATRLNKPTKLKDIRAALIAEKKNAIRVKQQELINRIPVLQERVNGIQKLIDLKDTGNFGEPAETVLAKATKELNAARREFNSNTKLLSDEKPIRISKAEIENYKTGIAQEQDAIKQTILEEKEAERQALLQYLEQEGDKYLNEYTAAIDEIKQLRATAVSTPTQSSKPGAVTLEAPSEKLGPQRVRRVDAQTSKEILATRPTEALSPADRTKSLKELEKMIDDALTEKPLPVKTEGGRPLLFKGLPNYLNKVSKPLAKRFEGYVDNLTNYKVQMLDYLTPAIKTLEKFENIPEYREALANNRIAGLPEDLIGAIESLQPFFKDVVAKLEEKGSREIPLIKVGDYWMPRRVRNLKGLKEKINSPEILREAAFKPSREREAFLSDSLEKGRTIKEVTQDLLPFYDSPSIALRKWSSEVAEDFAKADFFKDNLNKDLGSLIRKVITEEQVPVEAQPMVYGNLVRYFDDKGFKASPAYKAIKFAINWVNMTRPATALIQGVSAPLIALTRTGIISTTEALIDSLAKLGAPSKTLVAKRGFAGNPQDFTDIGQIKTIGQVIQLMRDPYISKADKTLSIVNKAGYIPLQIFDTLEKNVHLVSSYNWMKRNPKAATRWMQRNGYSQKEIDDVVKNLAELRANKYTPVSPKVYAVVDAHAGRAFVRGEMDKPPVYLSDSEITRTFGNFQTWALKNASTLKQETVDLMKNGTYNDKLDAVKRLTGFLTLVVPGTAIGSQMLTGEFDSVSDSLQDYPRDLMQQVSPTTMRVGRLIAAAGKEKDSDKIASGLNQIVPGSGTALSAVMSNINTLVESPFDLLNPNINKGFKYIFRPITEPIANASATGRLAREERRLNRVRYDAQGKDIKRQKIENDLALQIEKWNQLGGVPKELEGLKMENAGKSFIEEKIAKSKELLNERKKYGQMDTAEASNVNQLEAFKAEADTAYVTFLRQQLAIRGINQVQFDELMKNRHPKAQEYKKRFTAWYVDNQRKAGRMR